MNRPVGIKLPRKWNNETKKYEPAELGPERGIFLAWGLEVEQGEIESIASGTVAIVEMPGGDVRLVHPDYIRFLDGAV